MRTLVEDYDIVVVGAGHAGCEAALAGARLGLNTGHRAGRAEGGADAQLPER